MWTVVLQDPRPWDSQGKNPGADAVPSSGGSSQPRDQTHVSCVSYIAGGFFTAESPGKLVASNQIEDEATTL